jgi:hypothetical protein
VLLSFSFSLPRSGRTYFGLSCCLSISAELLPSPVLLLVLLFLAAPSFWCQVNFPHPDLKSRFFSPVACRSRHFGLDPVLIMPWSRLPVPIVFLACPGLRPWFFVRSENRCPVSATRLIDFRAARTEALFS